MTDNNDDGEQLSPCYPPVMPWITDWCHGDKTIFPGAIVPVSEQGLRHVLLIIKRMQAVLLDAAMQQNERALSPVEIALMNDTSNIWCEDDLVVSGLFVAADPMYNYRAEEYDVERVDGTTPEKSLDSPVSSC